MKISNVSSNTNFKANFSPRMNRYVDSVGNNIVQNNNKEELKEYIGLVKDIKSTLKCGTIDFVEEVPTLEHPLVYDNYQLTDKPVTSESCNSLDVLKKISSSLKEVQNTFFKTKSDTDVFSILAKNSYKK